jgi:hypothetical protein
VTVDHGSRLIAALTSVRGQWDAHGYRFTQAPSATLATVWRGSHIDGLEVAVCLTPKPVVLLIQRVTAVVDEVATRAAPPGSRCLLTAQHGHPPDGRRLPSIGNYGVSPLRAVVFAARKQRPERNLSADAHGRVGLTRISTQ